MAITYNGTPFLGQPTPFVKIANEYIQDGAERIDRTVITLSGELLGCSKAELEGYRQTVLTAFNSRGTLVVDGLGTFYAENVISVSFDDSDYFSRLPYTITIQIKDPDTVLDKSVEVSFEEQKDQSLTITRTISCKGKPASGSGNTAWQNAKAYIASEGAKSLPRPYSIDGKTYNYFLISSQESIDRINNTISLTQTYKCDLFYGVGPILRYNSSVELSSAQSPIIRISGTIEYRREGSYVDAKALYQTIRRPSSYITQHLTGYSSEFIIQNETLNIDEHAGQISFSFEFVEKKGSGYVGDYVNTWSISLDEGSDTSLISVDVNGVFKIKEGVYSSSARAGLNGAFSSEVVDKDYLFNECLTLYRQFFPISDGSNIVLKPTPLKASYSVSKDGTEVIWSASFDDRFLIDGFQRFSYTLNVKPSIEKIQLSPSLLGGYYFLDLGYLTRAEASVDVTSEKCSEGLNFNNNSWGEFQLRSHISQDDRTPANVILTEKSYSANNASQFSSKISATCNGLEFAL